MSLRRRLGLVPFVLACTAAPVAAAQSTAFVFTSDFSTGSLSAVNLDTRAVSQDVAPPFVCADARLRWYQGRLYVVNRLGCDNILVLDPSNGYSVVRQFSVGNGSNPADISFLSPTKAYVTRYELASILIVNPETGAELGQISLAPFADADGIPEMDRMIRVGNRMFVSVQRLDRNGGFQPTDSSSVVVIDTDQDTVLDVDPGTNGVQAITLATQNPVTAFAFDRLSSRLLIGCVGGFGQLDGGIEWVDPIGFTSGGLAIDEAELGGDLGDLAWNGSERSYAVVSDAAFNSMLVSWSANSGTTLDTLYSPGGFSIPDCEINDRGELYVCDSRFASPGVHVFSTANDQPIAGPLDTGLPPYQVTFDEARDLAAVAELPPTFALSPPWPNPTRGTVRLGLRLEHSGPVGLEVFDLLGRRVTSVSREFPSGISELIWNLQGRDGRQIEPGFYMIRARIEQKIIVRRVAVVY